ncbi:MAG: CocE/NonD family hydrolase [Actinobacteria bacterium]|nr:CocE/NonD family hydrolase [Actinomycetota bacterium]
MRADAVAGDGPGQRRLNGPQTTGRSFRNLSRPEHRIRLTPDQNVVVRDGTVLQADVFTPDINTPVPALLAVSCYPRQIQNSGAPLGFVEAGATDFWVPRGYAHVIANTRGTGGSQGRFNWLDETERQDVADLVEWTAAQHWCDGRVGMIGISYFAMTQLAAAVERPEHLRAIFPVATTVDPYEAVWHGDLLSESFVVAWLAGVAAMAERDPGDYRSWPVEQASKLLRLPRLHRHFEDLNGEAALTLIRKVMKTELKQPWLDLLNEMTLIHQTKDEWWASRDMLPGLAGCTIPTYLGCDWENVPLHLPSTFRTWEALSPTAPVRMGMLGAGGLTWPWESLHTEALAWFDHWLKDRDTGIMDGPPVRYLLPGTEEFLTSPQWPPPDTSELSWQLSADGVLAHSTEGERRYWHRGRGVSQQAPGLPDLLQYDTAPLAEPFDFVGTATAALEAGITAPEVSWILTLQDVAPDGTTTDVTAGWARIARGEPGSLHTHEVSLVPNARRFVRGHRLRLVIASDDTSDGHPAIMGFRHRCTGDPSINRVSATSTLSLPVLT